MKLAAVLHKFADARVDRLVMITTGRMFLLLGMKCIRKLFSAAVISSWIF